jgi:hypothetical protein
MRLLRLHAARQAGSSDDLDAARHSHGALHDDVCPQCIRSPDNNPAQAQSPTATETKIMMDASTAADTVTFDFQTLSARDCKGGLEPKV